MFVPSYQFPSSCGVINACVCIPTLCQRLQHAINQLYIYIYIYICCSHPLNSLVCLYTVNDNSALFGTCQVVIRVFIFTELLIDTSVRLPYNLLSDAWLFGNVSVSYTACLLVDWTEMLSCCMHGVMDVWKLWNFKISIPLHFFRYKIEQVSSRQVL